MSDSTVDAAPRLRDYQTDALRHCFRYWRKEYGRAPVIVAPPGAGKSHIIAGCVQVVHRKNPSIRILLLTHRLELLEQDAAKISAYCPDIEPAIYSASLGRKEIGAVTCAQIQSWARRDGDDDPMDLVVIDEAHLVPVDENSQYRSVLTALARRNPKLKIMGLTATPYRLDQGDLCEGAEALFDGIAFEIEIDRLVERSPPVMVRPTSETAIAGLDLSKVKKSLGEYKVSDQDRETQRNRASIASHIVKRCWGRKGLIVFCAGVEGAEVMAKELSKRGITAECVVGSTPNRAEILQNFREQRTFALTSCDVLTHGVDFPHADTLALVRATTSTSLYVQMVGRGLRYEPGKKDCLVLDFGGNLERHGPLNNLVLKRPAETEGEGETAYKTCPGCGSSVLLSLRTCPHCGHRFEKILAEDAATGEFLRGGDLLPVDAVNYRRYRKASADSSTPDCIRVIYTYAGYRQISEFLFPDHRGFPRLKWLDRRKQLGAKAWTVSEAEREWHKWRKPSKLQVGRDPRKPQYLRIVKFEYSNPLGLSTSTTPSDIESQLTQEQLKRSFHNAMSALHLAVEAGVQADSIRAMVNQGANPGAVDGDGNTPLHFACQQGQEAAVSELVKNRDQLHVYNSEGLMPLHTATSAGHVKLVNILLHAGANPDAPSAAKHRNAPLHFAALGSKPEMVSALIDGGANLRPPVTWYTPIMLAARWGRSGRVLARLLELGANPHETNWNGSTLLHLAAENRRGADMLRILLKAGVDPGATNKQGQTAADLARKNKSISSKPIVRQLDQAAAARGQ
ncbi:MAG: ankyrin repeat domain-containing protein [Rhodobacteraceae bacterium]|nr:ankyrin repeat domain-containing protein [Paracoccaceae bacterium]